ncbi:MAG: transposase family protein [Gammaproteobacteria bacterium]
MRKGISKRARTEVIAALRQRYQSATKAEKARILDEFVAVAQCHRKHAVRLLGNGDEARAPSVRVDGRRVYDEAVSEALIIAWEAADRICGKRLKAILPSLVDAMERHGHLNLEPTVRERVLGVSAATIDRLLEPVRSKAGRRRRRRGGKKISQQVPIRTFADWHQPPPGYLEIDFVAHCGGSLSGSFIHSLVVTDVCSGWTEAVPLLAREQSLVVAGLEAIDRQLPVPTLGIDADNDSAFINETLLGYCERKPIEFTRSRAYRKNDQAWIEQKNGAVVRRFVGYDRYAGPIGGQTLAHLYAAVRLYVNYFQPSFKLLEKTRAGAKVRKRYDRPTTPCDRLLAHPSVDAEIKAALQQQRMRLDPIELLHRIRDAQAALADPQLASGPHPERLEAFLARLPDLWRLGEVRPTHAQRSAKPRTWRTRKDPFEGVWSEVLLWLQHNPDATAKALFERLRNHYPGRFTDGQIRTLYRRVKQWRSIMASQLLYAGVAYDETQVIGALPELER